MRVLFVTNLRYPPQGLGGARVTAHHLCQSLQSRGHDVAALGQIQGKGLLWLGNRLRARLRGRSCPPDRVLGYPVYRGWDPIGGIPEVVRDFRPEIAIVGTDAIFTMARSLIGEGIPVIAYFQSMEFEKMGQLLAPQPVFKGFAVSKYTAQRVRQETGHDCEVWPALIRAEYYETETRRERVLHVNTEEDKGIQITLALAERRPDILFDVVRCWPPNAGTAVIRKRVAQLPNVRWHEPVSDMRVLYRNARILIVPSLWEEASGRVVTEAQFSGIPVLASNRGGLPESVGAGGLVVDADADLSAWEAALTSLWDDEDFYRHASNAARRHAHREEARPERIMAQLEAAMTELAGSGRMEM